MHNGEWGREGRYLRVVTGVPLIAVSPQRDGVQRGMKRLQRHGNAVIMA